MATKLDNIDQFVVETVFKDNGAIKGFTTLDQQQKKVISNNKDIAKTNKEVTTTGFALGRAFKAIGAYLGIRELARYADEWTNIKSILSLVTENEKERLYVQERLFDISQGTRQNMLSTVDLYRRITTATESLGLSEQKRLQITEAINKSLIIGGGSTAGNQAALVQLGQGLASGQLRGEELNSILEQSPRLAQMIAEGMGLRVGQLREVAMQGQLTPEKVLGAILNQAPKVNAEFEKMGTTIGQAFVILGNSLGKFINRINEMTGASQGLANVIVFLAENIEQVAILLISAFIPRIAKSIPLLNLMFAKIGAGAGFVKTLRVALTASLPAMKAWTAQAWAMSAPFMKIYLAIELVLQAIKMLKGEWNFYSEAIDQIERKTWGALNWIGEKTGWWEQRKNFKGSFSEGEYTGYFSNAPENMRGVSEAAQIRQSNANVRQNVNVTIYESRNARATGDEVLNRINNQMTLGVLS